MRDGIEALKFRDVATGRRLIEGLERVTEQIGRSGITVMHVCGSHEQAMGRFGLRAAFPPALHVVMGPGCPVCITDAPEVDEAVALALQGVRVTTFGDMLRVPGSAGSLDAARAEGARVDVVYGVAQAVEIAQSTSDEIVFFATGFETTAVATAAMVLRGLPSNLSILSAHKYIPPAMEVVGSMPETTVEGYLAAGHAATITGWSVFEPFAERHRVPVVVTGFEPLDILAGLTRVLTMIRDGEHGVLNAFPRCVTAQGNTRALETLWRVFEPAGGQWRGIATVDGGNLELRADYDSINARKRFTIDIGRVTRAPSATQRLAEKCLCGPIMAGRATPTDCRLYGKECTVQTPVGACMVSTEGMCRIWAEYGGRPDLSRTA